MLNFLYELVIQPIINLIEIIFSVSYRYIGSAGPSIIVVSLVVSILILPLYRTADRLQKEERDRQQSMSKWVNHIRAHFKGDERYMMLSAYYREQNYKPIYGLRSSISLLLQIPFFIAAYRYLSDLEILQNTSFLAISNLGAPDQLIHIAGYNINLLPILMTAFNVASGVVYTRGFPLKDKVQTYGLALLFLVLLYRSPSGLVLYWTCNQVFSLLKNLVPTVVGRFAPQKKSSDKKKRWAGWFCNPGYNPSRVFLVSALLLTLLVGVLIPSALLGSSAAEFINTARYVNPFSYLFHTATVAAGFFLLWLSVFFYLSSAKAQWIMSVCLAVIAACSLINYFFFGNNLGVITTSIVYETGLVFADAEVVANCIVVIAIAIVVVVVTRFAPKVIVPLFALLSVAVVATTVPNYLAIKAADEDALAIIAENNTYTDQNTYVRDDGSIVPTIHLSRTGKNVVTLFLDRGISGYFPYLIEDHPEIAANMTGFVYYPNTISYGARTVFGSPSIFGGYDYSVAGMNARTDTSLKDKHNEAVQLLPMLFEQQNYKISLLSETLVDYRLGTPDYSLFEKFKNVTVYDSGRQYDEVVYPKIVKAATSSFERNLLFYGLLKSAPVIAQPSIYDEGRYWSTVTNHAINREFIDYYSVLKVLDDLTYIDDDYDGSYVRLHSLTTHTPDFLQLPECEPALYIQYYQDDTSRFDRPDGQGMLMDDLVRANHYYAFVATFNKLNDWFTYLKQQGVWDNTRIIIISDHGYELGQFPNLIYDENLDIEMVNPIFLVKDFDASDELQVSDEFMTTSDCAWMSLEDIVEDPVNPFTGNPIDDEPKLYDQIVTTSTLWDVRECQQGAVFDTWDGHYYSVHDNIFDLNNWKRLD